MKRVSPIIKAHLIRGAFYMLLAFALCVIPFALAQRTTEKQTTAGSAMQLPITSSDSDRDATALPTREFPTGLVLYDQYNNPATEPPINIGSQNFEPAMAAFNDQAADDFVLPTPPPGINIFITRVRVMGEYSEGGGPASSFNVYFYSNGAGNLPGTLISAYLNLSYRNSPGLYDQSAPSHPHTPGNQLDLRPGSARFQPKWSVVLAQSDCSIKRRRCLAKPGRRLRHGLHQLEPKERLPARPSMARPGFPNLWLS